MRLFTVLKLLQIYSISMAILAVIFIKPLCNKSPLSNEVIEGLASIFERGPEMNDWLSILTPEGDSNDTVLLGLNDLPKEVDLHSEEMVHHPKNLKSAADLARVSTDEHEEVVDDSDNSLLPLKKPDAIVETITKDLNAVEVTAESVTKPEEIVADVVSTLAPQFLNTTKVVLTTVETVRNGSFVVAKTVPPLADVTFVPSNKIDSASVENVTIPEHELEASPAPETKTEEKQNINETSLEVESILPQDPPLSTSTEASSLWRSLFGRKKRLPLNLLNSLFAIKGKIENQTVISIERCEEIDPWAYDGMLFFSGNVFQDVTAERHYCTIALVVHLLVAVYHLFSNCCSRIPWSHSANRTVAVVSFLLWAFVCGWVMIQRHLWDSKFTADATLAGIPFIPAFPKQYYIILVLSFIMFTFLAIEIVDHKALFVNLSLQEVGPNMGYVRAAQNENDYIESVIEQLEMSQMSPENPSEVISRAIDLKNKTIEN
uniref:Uncharacterized protein n=1 Tax=Panagrolaimus sp. JU765 TaxID=591449 RepID=A0AC34Q549_9BILA